MIDLLCRSKGYENPILSNQNGHTPVAKVVGRLPAGADTLTLDNLFQATVSSCCLSLEDLQECFRDVQDCTVEVTRGPRSSSFPPMHLYFTDPDDTADQSTRTR